MNEFVPFETRLLEGVVNADGERIHLYTAELPAEVVAHFTVEAAVAGGGQGFQRHVDLNRAARIGKLQGGERKTNLPPQPNVHGGLLAYADEDDIQFGPARSGSISATIMRPLRLIDGQHRARGAQWAVENGMTADYTETVRIVMGAERSELALWYLRANIEARKTPPANVILNAAQMNGVVMRRKSWIARIVVALATQEPLVVGEKPLVSWQRGDGGMIAPQTIYRAVDVFLPANLNAEGDIETDAVKYAWEAINTYAEQVEGWGATDEDGDFEDNESYSFTSMVAFAHLYFGLKTHMEGEAAVEEALGKVLPFDLTNVGAGERAAVNVAAYAAGQLGLELSAVA